MFISKRDMPIGNMRHSSVGFMKKFCLVIILACLFCVGCSHQEVEDNSNPAGDIGEGFSAAQEPRTYRTPRYQPSDYFFKNCEQRFGDNYYSKTSYFCNDH
jgi:hypothetical protein